MKNHNVILFVDTANITEKNIEDNSWFGYPNRVGDNKDWYTDVDPGDTITWLGLSSSSPNDIVNITKIEHEHKTNLFGRSKLKGDGGSPEKVIGTVSDYRKGDDSEEEIYKIIFTVYNVNNGGKRNGEFRIDPKITVNK